MENIYQDIAARTGGNIYIGVVGPVRTGKSTMIKRIMEQLVIPNIEDIYRKERARDELPQSASGRTIMTSEPKFIPEEAVEISPDGTCALRVRMIDSVGYMIPGAVGAEEDGIPRMVTTPWCDTQIPMTEAAELGTQKVMQEHCSMGLLVTTDGSVTDIPRQDYIEAEARAIRDMKATGKPFLVVVNTTSPASESAQNVKGYLAAEFGITPYVADCQSLDTQQICEMLTQILYQFPMQQLQVYLPRWIDALEPEHPVKEALFNELIRRYEDIHSLAQAESTLWEMKNMEQITDLSIRKVDPGKGVVSCTITLPETLFYEIISSRSGIHIENESQLLSTLTQLSQIKVEYDKIADALDSVKATGYGIVMPTAQEMTLQTPEVVRKGGAFGVKLKAGAPSIHMIRVDIDTQISPMVGGEQQSQELIGYLSTEEPEKLWQSNIFGKSVYELVQEGLNSKLLQTPDEVREKFRGSLTRIVNEGAAGLICLIL